MLFELYCPIYWYWSAPLQRVGYSNLNGTLAETVKDALYDKSILFHDWILLLIYSSIFGFEALAIPKSKAGRN
jgi:ABC-type multidrug transport system permease subunit